MSERLQFILRLANGRPIRLDNVYPRERLREFAETFRRAVESDQVGLFGDGGRTPTPVELEAWVEIPGASRTDHARRVSEIERDLPDVTALEFDDLRFPTLRVRLMSTTPVEANAYKITLRFYGTQHDFQDSHGRAVPLI